MHFSSGLTTSSIIGNELQELIQGAEQSLRGEQGALCLCLANLTKSHEKRMEAEKNGHMSAEVMYVGVIRSIKKTMVRQRERIRQMLEQIKSLKNIKQRIDLELAGIEQKSNELKITNGLLKQRMKMDLGCSVCNVSEKSCMTAKEKREIMEDVKNMKLELVMNVEDLFV